MQWHAENAKDNPKIIHASEACAAGIIQAIGHFGLGPNTSLRDMVDILNSQVQKTSASHEVVKFSLLYERLRRAEVEDREKYIAALKAYCVCLDSVFCSHQIHISELGMQNLC